MSVTYQKIINLVNYLNECTKAYDEGKPLITDKEWDDLYFQLEQLEKEAGLILSNSPTQSISFEVVNELQKVEHDHKMLSLEKTKSADEVLTFCKGKQILAMCKMDGLTCSLTYEHGELIKAETRGNGIVGEDIWHNAKVVKNIPLEIPYEGRLVVDGEIICRKDDFIPFQKEYKNPRNFASGSIRLLSSEECKKRNLSFVAWEMIEGYPNIKEFWQRLEQLYNIGFTIVPMVCDRQWVDEALEVIQEQFKEEHAIYPIDGYVFKFNDVDFGKKQGQTDHHLKNAIAYKLYDETYSTRLKYIQWTMGRTGVLTPVAIFEAIDMDGSTVERASLHNISIMEELLGDPYRGQKIEVFKANMIIPQIYSAEKMNGDSEVPFIDIPEECPICGGEVKKTSSGDSTFLVCSNPSCDGKLINRLDHFCGKKGLDMKGISKATLEKLIDWGWVSDFTDIFELSIRRSEWVQKPGFGAKSVEKVLNAINTGANCELHQFIAALGIPLIGSTASKELAKHFETWEKFVEAAEGGFAFYTLPNFGSEMHNSIIKFNYAEARLLADHYIHFNIPEVTPAPVGESLTGKTFVITGKLTHFKNRDEIKSRIEALGGKVTGSVSKNTNYLINNDVNSTSSKNATAKSLGIPILSEEDFIQTFGIM